jgi:thiol-disulfide isomerase/thioredoxin
MGQRKKPANAPNVSAVPMWTIQPQTLLRRPVAENPPTNLFVTAATILKKPERSSAMTKKNQAPDDIETVFLSKERAFVLFYASWCPFSQMFLPIFKAYTKQNPEECVSVLADNKTKLCDKYEINYYPTVILFKKGKVHKRLDATPGEGLTKKQLSELTANS